MTLTHSFILQQFELTVSQWQAVGWPSLNSPGDTSAGDCMDPQCPAAGMTWYDAARFANDVSIANGLTPCYEIGECLNPYDAVLIQPQCSRLELLAKSPYECEGYRLPTDAEWEYAVRAGTTTAFYSGDIRPLTKLVLCEADPNAEAIGWYCFNAPSKPPLTQHGGSKRPNGWGFYDMSGNAYEWVGDPFSSVLDATPVTDPWRFPKPGDHLLRRGGAAFAWTFVMRSGFRSIAAPNQAEPALGLRLARTLAPAEVGQKWAAPSFRSPDGGLSDAGPLDAGGQ